jgi:hypothetical protein
LYFSTELVIHSMIYLLFYSLWFTQWYIYFLQSVIHSMIYLLFTVCDSLNDIFTFYSLWFTQWYIYCLQSVIHSMIYLLFTVCDSLNDIFTVYSLWFSQWYIYFLQSVIHSMIYLLFTVCVYIVIRVKQTVLQTIKYCCAVLILTHLLHELASTKLRETTTTNKAFSQNKHISTVDSTIIECSRQLQNTVYQQ